MFINLGWRKSNLPKSEVSAETPPSQTSEQAGNKPTATQANSAPNDSRNVNKPNSAPSTKNGAISNADQKTKDPAVKTMPPSHPDATHCSKTRARRPADLMIPDNKIFLEENSPESTIAESSKSKLDRKRAEELTALIDLMNEGREEEAKSQCGIFGESVNEFFDSSEGDMGDRQDWIRRSNQNHSRRRESQPDTQISARARGHPAQDNAHARWTQGYSHSGSTTTTPSTTYSRPDIITPPPPAHVTTSRAPTAPPYPGTRPPPARSNSLVPYERSDSGVIRRIDGFTPPTSPTEDDQSRYYSLLMKEAEAKAGYTKWKPTGHEAEFMEKMRKAKLQGTGSSTPTTATTTSFPETAKSATAKLQEEVSVYTTRAAKDHYYALMQERATVIASGRHWDPPTPEDKEIIMANTMGEQKYLKYKARQRSQLMGETVEAGDLSDEDWEMIDLDETEKNKGAMEPNGKRGGGLMGWIWGKKR